MSNTLNEYDELRIGDMVGHPIKRMVIAYTKRNDRVVGDVYASWITICINKEELHPYVVWTVIARPEGFVSESGDYCSTLEDALKAYKKRGGEN